MNVSKQQLSQSDKSSAASTRDVSIAPVTATKTSARWQMVETSHGTDLAAYLEIPFIHKRLILTCLISCLGLGWLALLIWPRKYESEAKLMVRVGRESVSLDPTATTSPTLMLQKTQEEEINSALEVLSSRQVAQRAVAAIGAAAILDGTLPPQNGSPRPETTLESARRHVSDALDYCLRTTGVKDAISDHEMAVRRLQSTVTIHAPKKSTVITIHAESKTPEMAQAIAQEITRTFLDQHLQVSKTEGSQKFFQEQSAASEAKLNEQVEKRRKFMQQRKIVSIETNRGLLKDQLSAIDRDIHVARGELQQTKAEIDDLKGKVAAADDEIVSARQEISDTTWSGMRQRVYELELQEKSYAAIYTDNHEKLVQTREQLQGARDILANLQSERVDESTTPNPVKRRMQEDLQKLQTKAVGLGSILAEKEEQHAETELQIDQLLDFEQQLMQMDRNIALMETSLHVLQEKREEARVIDELQSQRISNISAFQPATFVERPVSPRKRLLAVGFAVLGLIGGIGLAFLREAGSRTLRTAEHVQSHLQYPVVSQIPRIKQLVCGGKITHHLLRQECRVIISEILLSRGHRHGGQTRGRSLGIMGVDAGCGASTLAASLAIASSEDCGLKTTLVDADSQSRTISKAFDLNGAPGLAELVSGDASHDDCVQHSAHSNVELISCSGPSANRRTSVNPDEIVQALEAFQQDSDLLIVDLPPANQPDYAIALAQHLDSILVVVESERTGAAQAGRLLRRLSERDSLVLGIVLNKTRHYLPRWIGRYVASQA